LKTDQVAQEEAVPLKTPKERSTVSSESVGINVVGADGVLIRVAKCCTPVPGDAIVGYISLGKGITVHREDCPNVRTLMRNPERFTPVEWDGGATKSFRVQIAVDSWDRPRLLEDVARTFAEHGANIVSYGGVVDDQLAKNWYTAEVGDVAAFRAAWRTASLERGMTPRTGGVARTRDGAGRRSDYNESGGRGCSGRVARPARTWAGTRLFAQRDRRATSGSTAAAAAMSR